MLTDYTSQEKSKADDYFKSSKAWKKRAVGIYIKSSYEAALEGVAEEKLFEETKTLKNSSKKNKWTLATSDSKNSRYMGSTLEISRVK